MTSTLRLPILGLGRRCLICPSFMRFIINSYFFILVNETFYQLYHPRMASSPRPLLRSTVLQEHNNGKIPYMERQAGQDIRCVHVTLHLTVTGLSRMSINPFTSFNSPTVPDKPYVMKLTTLCSVRITLWGKPLQDPCPCHNKLL